MFKYSPTYNLASFVNEQYNSFLDKDRMTTIDQTLQFAYNMVGQCVVSGLEITATSTELTINKGHCVIDSASCFLRGNQSVPIPFVGNWDVYLQKRNGSYIGASSGSNIASVLYTDSSFVNPPTNPSVQQIQIYSISIIWTNSVDSDISFYSVQRSTDLMVWDFVGQSSSNSFTDPTVEQDTSYVYRVKAVDINGNSSSFLQFGAITTQSDLSAPPQPTGVVPIPLDSSIMLYWQVGPPLVDRYIVTTTPVDLNGAPIGPASAINVTSNSVLLSGLTNGTRYKFSVRSISVNSVGSLISTHVFQYPIAYSLTDVNSVTATSSHLAIKTSISSLNLINATAVGNVYGVDMIPSQTFLSISSSITSGAYILRIYNDGMPFDDIIYNPSTPVNIYLLTTKKVTNHIQQVYKGVPGVYGIIPNKTYIVQLLKVLTQDSNGNVTSTGSPVLTSIVSTSFIAPLPVTNLTSQVDFLTNDIIFAWDNSATSFQSNFIKLQKKQISTNITSIVFNYTDIQRQSTFTLPFTSTQRGYEYTLSVYASNIDGNNSIIQTSVFTIAQSDGSRPLAPFIDQYFSNDGYVYLHITPDPLQNASSIKKYNIWRADYSNTLKPSSFSIVASISSTLSSYIDYSVQNDHGYVYFATSQDYYGTKSLNPIDDNYSTYPYIKTYPHSNICFSAPKDLTAIINGFDIILSWSADENTFDFYQIYRSSGDSSSFELIGSTSSTVTMYVDWDVAINNGVIYKYFIKKVRNDVNVILSPHMSSAPYKSIQLATISMGSFISIDYIANNVSNAQMAVFQSVSNDLRNHKHLVSSVDARIDLSQDLILTSLTTSNNLVYTFNSDISQATKFFAFIDGQPSTTPFFVNKQKNTVTFLSKVTGVVSLLCIDVNQTVSSIQQSNLGDIQAETIFGTLTSKQISKIDHDGRINQTLIPFSFELEQDDLFTYSIKQNKMCQVVQQDVGVAISPYSAVPIPSTTNVSGLPVVGGQANQYMFQSGPAIDGTDSYAVSTSFGIQITVDSGKTWYSVIQSDQPFSRIILSRDNTLYIAISKNKTYISYDILNWTALAGTQSCIIIRDIAQTLNNNFIISTNLGVFTIDAAADSLWQFKSQVGQFSSDMYGLFFDQSNNQITISGQNQTYTSLDFGQTWSFNPDLYTDSTVFSFCKSPNTVAPFVFAVSKKSVWRKGVSDVVYQRIATMSSQCRKIEIFMDSLYIISQDGLFVSSQQSDIYQDVNVNFQAEQQFAINQQNFAPSMLCVVDGALMVGVGSQIIASNDGDNYVSIFRDNRWNLIPSIFNGDKPINVGYYYGKNYVLFDSVKPNDSSMSVANQYRLYAPINGNWSQQSYNAPVTITSGLTVSTTSRSASVDLTSLFNSAYFLLDESFFTSTNSNLQYVNLLIQEYNDSVSSYSASISSGLYDSIAKSAARVFFNFNKITSQIKGQKKYYTPISYSSQKGFSYPAYLIEGKIVSIDCVDKMYPQVTLVPFIQSSFLHSLVANADTTLGPTTFDPIYGLIKIDTTATNRFLKPTISILNSNLYGVSDSGIFNSHKNIDDIITRRQSGMRYNMATASYANLINRSAEETIQNSTINLSSAVDKLNSSVNYTQTLSNYTQFTNISFVMDVCYNSLNNKIIVGGIGGLVAIQSSGEILDVPFFRMRNIDVTCVLNAQTAIYACSATSVYISVDGGVTWQQFESFGISGDINKICITNQYLTIFTSDGVYNFSDVSKQWVKNDSFITITGATGSATSFAIDTSGVLKVSYNGVEWSGSTIVSSSALCINQYNGVNFVGTKSGLMSDNSSFNGGAPSLGLVNISGLTSASHIVTAISSSNTKIAIGTSSGKYYVNTGGIWQQFMATEFKSIHKILIVNGQVWIFGYNIVKGPADNSSRRIVSQE